MRYLKSVLRKSINSLGYSIHRMHPQHQHDLPMYRQLYDHESVQSKGFYNIGAGNSVHPAWTDIDHSSEWYSSVEIDWDLLSLAPLPVEGDSAEIVYASQSRRGMEVQREYPGNHISWWNAEKALSSAQSCRLRPALSLRLSAESRTSPSEWCTGRRYSTQNVSVCRSYWGASAGVSTSWRNAAQIEGGLTPRGRTVLHAC